MSDTESGIQFVVKPVPTAGGASEFRQSMAPHPLVYQELPHDPAFGVYNRRLRSLSYGNCDALELYWRLRQQVMVSHTGELPIEISGPDAEALLERVFTRSIANNRVGRCTYQVACYADGTTIMDGVLVRLAPDRFWYGQGDGDFYGWLRAQAAGLDVAVFDPKIWVSQVQGPRSLDVLQEIADDGLPEPFRYFDMAEVRIGGQQIVITRTGFTNELGWEFYLEPGMDARAIGDAIMEAGAPYGIHTTPAEVTNARRIEGGLLFSGTDFDDTVTPFEAGFGKLVDFNKGDFMGREALLNIADQRNRTWGLKCANATARHGDTVQLDGECVGRVTSSAWSPTLQCGVAIVRMNTPDAVPGTLLDVACTDGHVHTAEVCTLPFYDPAGDIPRGRATAAELAVDPG